MQHWSSAEAPGACDISDGRIAPSSARDDDAEMPASPAALIEAEAD
ncbi:hypothetical protein [Bosea sp. MMO-172]